MQCFNVYSLVYYYLCQNKINQINQSRLSLYNYVYDHVYGTVTVSVSMTMCLCDYAIMRLCDYVTMYNYVTVSM